MNPDAILTADWHLRETVPICRTDNFVDTQWIKVDFVNKLQQKYMCPILHAGDLFENWKPSPYLLSMVLERLPDNFHTIYGNHDLPRKNLAEKERSGVFTLYSAGFLNILNVVHWDEVPNKIASIKIKDRYVLLWHTMVYKGKEPYPNAPNPVRPFLKKLIDEYAFDLVVTGHNHDTFTEEYDGALLVNPGSILRAEANELDYKPSVYLWYADDNRVERVYIPIEKDVVSREHIEIVKRNEANLEAYIERLNMDWSPEILFEKNMETFLSVNDIRTAVKNNIWEALE